MCMKYLNVTIGCYESIEATNGFIEAALHSFDSISGVKSNQSDEVTIGPFCLLTHINALGTNDPQKVDSSTLERGGKLDVIIRLTKCDVDESKQVFVDLDQFTIDFSKEETKDRIPRACFKYYNYSRITEVEPMPVPVAGKYVIKVIVSDDKQKKKTIQAMSLFQVNTNDQVNVNES